MECENCLYREEDGRCPYVVGCPYRQSVSVAWDGSMTFTIPEASSRKLIEMLEKQDKEWIDRLMDGKEKLTLGYGGKRVTLVPAPERGSKENPPSIEMNIFDKEEIHPNCTVQILTNTRTGEQSVGWWENPTEPGKDGLEP